MDKYPRDATVALCLVKVEPSTFEAIAVALSDGASFLQWTQGSADRFTKPI